LKNGELKKTDKYRCVHSTWLVNRGLMKKKLMKLLEDNVVTAGDYGGSG
jgi:hypothetical protein